MSLRYRQVVTTNARDEQAEAEDLADLLTLLRLRSSKIHPAPG
jgi:hypothetical protein